MLIKPKFEKDLKTAIKTASMPAAEKALSAMFTDNPEDPSKSLQQVDPEVKKKMKEFANIFSDKLSEKLSKSLADIIDAYIKSASINITGVPVPGATALTSPMGPVSGTIGITEQFVKIT